MSISDLSSANLIGLSSSLAIMLGENLSSEELAVLSSFFSAFSDNLAIISAKKALEDSDNNNNNDNNDNNNNTSTNNNNS